MYPDLLQKMVSPITLEEIYYPDSDGEPMAESDFQRNALMYCVDTLRMYFKARPKVYVSGNLLIYYEKGNVSKSVAPDVFVVFGVSNHDRSSYKVWEEGKGPDVVIEIMSKTNWRKDERNIELYRSLGVKEYFMYDPTGDCIDPVLKGYWLDEDGVYQKMHLDKTARGGLKLDSMLLHLELRVKKGQLRLYNPNQRSYLFSHAEEQVGRLQAEKQTEQERQRAEQERQRAERLLTQLRSLGIEPKEV